MLRLFRDAGRPGSGPTGRWVAFAALSVAIVLGGCGDSGDDAEPRSGSGKDRIVAEAKRQVAVAMRASHRWPGPNQPVAPPRGRKRLGIVPCGPTSVCQLVGKGVAQAAEALGWESKTVTPVSGSPQEVNAAFRRLIDDRSDAIVWVGFPRDILKASLAAAKDAGIPMVSASAADGDRLDVAQGDASAPMELLGEQLGWWMIADADGEAKVILLSDDEFPAGIAIDKGLRRVLDRCPDCELLEVKDIQAAEQSTVAPRETTNLLRRHPQATHVFSPFNSRVPFLVQGARQAQRRDVRIASTKADTPELKSMRSDAEPRLNATNTASELWNGWAAVDQLLRLMADQELVDHPSPILLRTRENADAPFFKPLSDVDVIDYPGRFKQLWGVD